MRESHGNVRFSFFCKAERKNDMKNKKLASNIVLMVMAVAMFSAQSAVSMLFHAGIFARCRYFGNQITQFMTIRIDRNNKIGNCRIACVVILIADTAMLVSFSARGLTSRVFFFYPTTKVVPVVWADGSFQRNLYR